MIKVIGKYVLDADSNCYTIGILTKTKVKNGSTREVIQDPSYYRTLPEAIKGICTRVERDKVKDTNGTLKDLYEAVQAAHKQLEAAITKMFPNVTIKED